MCRAGVRVPLRRFRSSAFARAGRARATGAQPPSRRLPFLLSRRSAASSRARICTARRGRRPFPLSPSLRTAALPARRSSSPRDEGGLRRASRFLPPRTAPPPRPVVPRWKTLAVAALACLVAAPVAFSREIGNDRPPHYRELLCIHRGEGSWSDPGAPYYGGLQMDWGFMRTYGGHLLRTKGTADHWTPLEQMWVAERAIRTRGFYPWPNTARACGLI